MQLSFHDLQQLNKDYFCSLSMDLLIQLCLQLSTDLKEAHDRLNQNSQNSSKPPSSEFPWNNSNSANSDKDEILSENNLSTHDDEVEDEAEDEAEDISKSEAKQENPEISTTSSDKNIDSKKPGKQQGAEGYGLKFGTNLEVTQEIHHQHDCCQACNTPFTQETHSIAYTARFEIELAFPSSGIGLLLQKNKHTYYDSECSCGHISRSEPGRCPKEEGWSVELTEWHMAGPFLIAFIVSLSKRQHMSRLRIHEFLLEWFDLHLCIGTINQCIHEAGRALSPVVENEIMNEILLCSLLHADETSWKEKEAALWLWVFSCATATLFIVGRRNKAMAQKILGEFSGWLMTDGYKVYRDYEWRLRCWAHLVRKARGLAESLEQEAQNFGKQTLQLLKTLIDAIYQARKDSTVDDIYKQHEKKLLEFRTLCGEYWDCEHKKTRALAREFCYDWEAIWCVLKYPSLPLTNNEAERALRHWVISRRISFGTRTAEGTKVFTSIASVIDTCYKRKVPPWKYIAEVIRVRRKGLPVPPLPAVA